jgi:hypothetical protein
MNVTLMALNIVGLQKIFVLYGQIYDSLAIKRISSEKYYFYKIVYISDIAAPGKQIQLLWREKKNKK